MATDILNCGSGISNMTAFECEAKYGTINAVWLSLVQFSDTFANALLEATWTTQINALASTRTFIFPGADDAIRNQEDPQFYDGNLSKRKMTRKGRVDFAFEYHDTKDCVWAVINSYNGQRMYAEWITENEAIIGGSNSTNFLGVPVDVFTSDPIPPENKDGMWKVILYVYPVNTEGNFVKAILPDDSTYNTGTLWKPSTKEGIVDVVFTEVSSAAGSVVVDITGACDSREITGLVVGDFSVTGLGSISFSNNRCTLTPTTTFSSPLTITLANQPSMTTKGYENQTPLIVTF